VNPFAGIGNRLIARFGALEPLGIRDYRLLWLGQMSHAFSLWMEQIARPWLVLSITENSAVHLGGVIAMRTLPQLRFGVFAGVVSDWFDRKTILQTTKGSVLVLSILFAVLVVSGRIELWHVYAFSFLRGSFMAFDQPARQSMIASIVPGERMTGAVALMSATQNTMRIVGTSAGGFAIALLGLGGTFVTVAVVYTGSVLATQLLRVPTHEKPPGTGARAMLSGLREGAVFAWQSTPIRGVLLMSLVYFTFGMSYTQVFAPLFAEEVLEIGSGGFGFMMSLTGVGALIGAVFIASKQPRRVGLVLPTVVMAFGGMLVIFSLSTYLPRPAGLVLPLVLIALTGMLQTGYFSLSNATLLHMSPPEMRGRVISLVSLDRAMVTLGASAAGFLASLVGVQVAQIAYGLVCVVGAAIIMMAFRGLREARIEGTFPTRRAHGAAAAATPASTPAASADPERPAVATR
jgi:MFS family permease